MIQNLKKKYGGGRRELNKSKLPIDLKYLFENKYIDCIQMLIILYQFKQRRKGINLDEILYYFTLLSLTITDSQSKFHVVETYIQNNYFTYENTIRDNLIILYNQKFIEINVESTKKQNIMYSKITDEGKSLVFNLKNSYFKKEIEKCKNIIETRKFNIKNQREVLMKN